MSSHLLTLLHSMTTTNVTAAQAQLNHLCQTHPQILDQLCNVLIDGSIEEMLRVVAVSYMNSAICDNLFRLQGAKYAQLLAEMLCNEHIPAAHKRHLERALITTIDTLVQPELTQLREVTHRLLASPALRDSAYLLIGCFAIPDSIDIQHLIYLTRVYLLPGLEKIVITNSEATLLMAREWSQVIKTWIVVWNRLEKEQSEQVEQLLGEVCDSEHLCRVLVGLYRWMAGKDGLFLCLDQGYAELHIIKEQAAELHIKALEFITKKTVEIKIYEATSAILGDLVNNLVLVTCNKDPEDRFQYRGFATNLLKILRCYFLFMPAVFKNQWKNILTRIVLPLLKPSQEQMASFEEDPQQFGALFEDCCEKQTFGVLKTQACKFVEKIVDKAEKVTQQVFLPDFIVNFAVDSIKNYWGQAVPNAYGMQYVSYDVAIVILAIFSYRLQSHRKQLSQLRVFFSQQVMSQMRPYDRTISYLFLAYNYGQIYTDPEHGAHWINCALHQSQHPTSMHCANDFLFNIADEFYSDYFLQQLGNRIETNAQGNIWDAFQKLFKTQLGKISQSLLMQILTKIYIRLQSELTKLTTEQVKQTINAIKLIQMIRAIANNENYLGMNPKIRQMVWQVRVAFDKAVLEGFQDEIIEIIYSLIRQQNVIGVKSLEMLPRILALFEKDEYTGEIYFKILNQYIMKGQSAVAKQIVYKLKNGLMYNLLNMNQRIRKSQKRLTYGHILILLQNIIGIHGQCLSQEQMTEISALMVRFMPQDPQKPIDSKVVLARALNTMLLCHLYFRADVTWDYIQAYVDKEIYYGYDVRVLLACASREIFNEKKLDWIAQILMVLARAIHVFRHRERLDEQAEKMKKKYAKENRIKLVKYKQYEKILKYMDTPFKGEQKFETILQNLLQKLKRSNPNSFDELLKLLPKNTIDQITELCKFTEGGFKKRVVYTTLKLRDPSQIAKVEDNEMQSHSDEDEEFKRKRVLNKKKGKNKGKPRNTMQ